MVVGPDVPAPDVRVILGDHFLDVLIELKENATNGQIRSEDFLAKVLRQMKIPKSQRSAFKIVHCGK